MKLKIIQEFFLGGDIEVSKKNKPLNIDYLNQLNDSFFFNGSY